MNYRIFFTFAIILFLSGCSLFSGEKNTNKVMADGFTPKELYAQAEDQVSAGLIDEAIEKYKLILASYPGSKYAIQARLDIAYNLFKRKKYNLAINELNKFIERYPSIEPTPYAYYLKGIIAEEKSSSILDDFVTDNAQRDTESVREAYDYYVELIQKFPDSSYSKEAKLKLNNLIDILARHEFYIAIYYTKKGLNIAAINRVKFVIENFPESSVMADSLHLMAYNYDMINAHDFAGDTRKILSMNYPDYVPNYSLKN